MYYLFSGIKIANSVNLRKCPAWDFAFCSHPPFWVFLLSACLLIVSVLLCVLPLNVKPNKAVEKNSSNNFYNDNNNNNSTVMKIIDVNNSNYSNIDNNDIYLVK